MESNQHTNSVLFLLVEANTDAQEKILVFCKSRLCGLSFSIRIFDHSSSSSSSSPFLFLPLLLSFLSPRLSPSLTKRRYEIELPPVPPADYTSLVAGPKGPVTVRYRKRTTPL